MPSTPSSSEGLSLHELGWSSFFEQQLESFGELSPNASLEPARVVFESREHYRVLNPRGERPARLAGRLRRAEEVPAVGDWALVTSSESSDDLCLVQHLLPRRTCLSRKVAGEVTRQQVVAANLDTVFLVMGLDGDYNLRRLERFVVMAHESGAEPVVVLTKADVAEDPFASRLDAQQVVANGPVFVVSALEGQGLDPLRRFLEPGRTVAMIGSSGAGKSTLLNSLSGEEVMRTGAVRASDDRGRHTTTHRQLVRLPSGGLLVDNPGVREIQLWADDEALSTAFDDIEGLAEECRFRDCRHLDEPGCRVLQAVEDGSLEAARVDSWHRLEREIQHLETKRDVATARRLDRAQGLLYKRIQQSKRSR